MESSKEDIGQKTKLGVLYSSAGRLGATAIMMVRTVVLVRLLDVKVFGVLQLCFTIVDFATTVGDFGFSAAQVQQREEVRPEQTNTLFLLDLALKGALFAIFMLSLSRIAAYFHEPMLLQVLPVMAAYMLVDAFSAPGLSLLTRRMQFAATAKIEFVSRGVDALCAIVLAFAGFGIWSLVWGRLLGSSVSGVMACVSARWLPSLRIDLRGSRGLVKFGGWLFVRNIFKYLTENVDYFVVGRFLGTRELGFYSKAFEVMRIPQQRLTRAIAVVLFPAFARVQDDRARVSSGLRRVVLATSLIAYPALVGLALVARDFVLVLFGERWLPMTVPLQVMCVAGVVHAVDPFLVSMLTALGLPRLAALRRLVEFVLLGAGTWFAVHYGITGVAVAVVGVALVTTLGTAAFAGQVGVQGYRDYLRPQLPALLASLAMAAVMLALRFSVDQFVALPAVARLLGAIVFGGVAYVAALYLWRPPEVLALWQEGAGDMGRVRASLARRFGGRRSSKAPSSGTPLT